MKDSEKMRYQVAIREELRAKISSWQVGNQGELFVQGKQNNQGDLLVDNQRDLCDSKGLGDKMRSEVGMNNTHPRSKVQDLPGNFVFWLFVLFILFILFNLFVYLFYFFQKMFSIFFLFCDRIYQPIR